MISEQPWGPERATSARVTWCRVCGHPKFRQPEIPLEQERCHKHRDRNPCAIEGCSRTLKAPDTGYLSCDDVLCGRHWRELVPVGSPERKIYNRFFRVAKRYGWTKHRRIAFWRFWRRLVSRARARARGDVNMDDVNRIMGW